MIARTFDALVILSNDTDCRIGVQIEMIQDPVLDPFAVTMIISGRVTSDKYGPGEPVTWHYSRELLAAGLKSPVKLGDGDVRFKREGRNLLICLRNGAGHAHLSLPARAVEHFLDQADDPAPDCLEAGVDELIEEILG